MRKCLSGLCHCQLIAVLALFLAVSAGAEEGPAWDDPPGDYQAPSADAKKVVPQRRGRGARGFEPHHAARQTEFTLAPLSSGLVFLEGEFLSPPYVVRSEGEQVLINDRPVLAHSRADRPGPWQDPRMNRSAMSLRLDEVTSALVAGNVLLSFDGQPLAVLSRSAAGYHLLALITREPHADRTIVERELPDGFDTEQFQQWIASYQSTPELTSHAIPVIEEVRFAEADSRRAIAAVRRSDTLLYLITVFGMVISVAATGHLLSAKPPTARDAQDDPEMLKMVSRSLGLVVILSSLDLFWTIMASQSGKMIELNPIGSQLLHDPMQLIAAKAAVICGSVGLLYFLRHHRQAQTAAWWACLICTLLTFRWLTFNSMFV